MNRNKLDILHLMSYIETEYLGGYFRGIVTVKDMSDYADKILAEQYKHLLYSHGIKPLLIFMELFAEEENYESAAKIKSVIDDFNNLTVVPTHKLPTRFSDCTF